MGKFSLKILSLLMGLLLSLQVFIACSQVSSNTLKTEVVLAPGWDINVRQGFDPTLGWNYYGPPLFFSTLVRRNQNLEVVNDLAQSYALGSDRKVWTVKIRTDARFSNGEPLTAEDVAFTFNQAKRSGGLVDVTVLDKAIATDKYTVEFHLKQPQFTFFEKMITLGIVPKHLYNENFARQPIGSGPYRFVQWDESQQLILEANPYYYGKPPNIQRIIILFTTGDAVFTAAKAGQIKVANVPQFLATQQIVGMKLYTTPNKSHYGLMFTYLPNTGLKTPKGDPIGNNVTADRAIRQAVNYAINRQMLVKDILEGYGSPAYGPVAKGLPWEEKEVAIQDADLQKAREILTNSGWRDRDGDGVVEKLGLKAEFTLIYPANEPLRQGLALAIAQMLKPVGIAVKVEGKSWEHIEHSMHSNTVLYRLSANNPQDLHFLYYSSVADGDYPNPGYYTNPVVDQAIERAMGASTYAEAIAFWKKVQWDGQTGVTTKGDAASAWLVNSDDTYFISNCLDIGRPPQSHKWIGQLLSNLPEWKWICN